VLSRLQRHFPASPIVPPTTCRQSHHPPALRAKREQKGGERERRRTIGGTTLRLIIVITRFRPRGNAIAANLPFPWLSRDIRRCCCTFTKRGGAALYYAVFLTLGKTGRDSEPCEHDRVRMNETHKRTALFSLSLSLSPFLPPRRVSIAIDRLIAIDLAADTGSGENRERP